MRSSIACSRCRRSKIKCMNNGTNTTCRACATTGRECVYPTPTPGQTTAKRADASGTSRNDGETETKRQRKRDDSARKNSLKGTEDPFETPQLMPKLWKDVYGAFMLHCSAELPFLHEEQFYRRAQQAPTERSADTQIFLLGMLALTARFIPELASAHNINDPLVSSEFYADALAARLDAPTLTREPSLERVQGLLMISLYHWTTMRGQSAFMYLTIAIGFARTMGLMFEDDPKTTKKPRSPALVEEAKKLGVRSKLPDSAGPKSDEQSLIQQEIKRRTVYSCFILDRYQASGRFRPQNINVDDLHVQLPCSEEDFQFGMPAVTGSLRDEPPSPATMEGRTLGTTQVLSTFIRLVEIWGRVSKWTCKGGRRQEMYPPWEPQSNFYELRAQVENFSAVLPPKLTFSTNKVSAHIAGGSITLYTAIHTLLSLCRMMLHREWIPFIPLRCMKPEGPLDEPIFPPGSAPQGFWEDSARTIMKSAREIMEIVKVTSERQVLVESPMVGFAIWTAAFAGIYSIHFSHMDEECYMCDPPVGKEDQCAGGRLWKGATALAINTLNNMKNRSKMACGWSMWTDRMHRYYEGMKRDFDSSIRALPGPSSDHQRRVNDLKEKPLREGGLGGGLEEYKLLERELKDFGPSLEQDRYHSPTPFSRGSTGAPNVKSEGAVNGDSKWAAVNTTAAPPTTTTGRLRDDYSQGVYPGQTPQDTRAGYYPRVPSQPPSLVSGNTRSTPGDMNSPYQDQSSAAQAFHANNYPSRPPDSSNQAAVYTQQMPGWQGQPQQQNEEAFKTLEQINMQGVDVAMFGGSLDGAYFPVEDWQNIVAQGVGAQGGVNFMEAASKTAPGQGQSPQGQ